MYPASVLSLLLQETDDQTRALWRIPILRVAAVLELPLVKDGDGYSISREIFGRTYTAYLNPLTNDWYCEADEEFPHSFLGILSTIDLVLFSSEGFSYASAKAFLLSNFPQFRLPHDTEY